MKVRQLLIALVVGAGLLLCGYGHALWGPEWQVTLEDSLDTGGIILKDSFALGAGGNGSDGYGLSEDVLKVYSPGWPDSGYSGPVRAYVGMESTVGGAKLAKDARATVVSGTAWNIDKVGNTAISGTETIAWDASDTNIPGALPLTLIDYGNDASRTSAVATVNMKTQSSYVVAVSGGPGTYRYMQVVAGSDPFAPPVISANVSGSDVIVSWVSNVGETYAVYYTGDITSGWTLGQAGIAGTGSEIQWIDSGAAAQSKRFYKVEVY
jgi:hypothetical protein